MKINPKIAKTPEELKSLEFKKMKGLIKKDLARLQKSTTADKPTAIMMAADFPYADVPKGVGFMLVGDWKGAFKSYAKNDIAKDNPMGAIGQAYFGGIDESGQKVIRIDLAKGKAKGKADKLTRSLKKLVPQATFNLVFGEMSEDALNSLEQRLDAAPEEDETFEDATALEDSEVEVDTDQDVQKLLDSNLLELSGLVTKINTEVAPRIKTRSSVEGDADIVIDTLDLANEWKELYNEAPAAIKDNPNNKAALAKVNAIIAQVSPIKGYLDAQGIAPTKTAAETTTGKTTIPSMYKDGEKPAPGMELGLSADALTQMYKSQGLSANCGASAKYMIYQYLEARGILNIDRKDILADDGRLNVQNAALDSHVSGSGAEKFKMGGLLAGFEVLQENKSGGGYTPNPNYKQAFSYIDKNLAKGLPVVAGVTHSHKNDNNGYNDGTTDHFIVIVGKKGNGYFYLDPANKTGGNAMQNFMEPTAEADYIFTDKNTPMGKAYIITTVAKYKKDEKDNSWMQDDGKPTSFNELPTDITTKLQDGSKDGDVYLLQETLNKLGYGLKVDGDFGTKTTQAVMDVQAKNGLPQTGIVEPNSPTWLAIKGKPAGGNTAAGLKPEQVQLQYKGGATPMNAKAEAVLRDILAKANEPAAAIVATVRTAQQQASVMYLNLESHGAKVNRKMYKDKTAAGKVIDAYEREKAAGKTKDQIIGAMLAVGGFDKISEHCDAANPAIDIHPASIKNKGNFEAILKADARLTVICPPKDTTYHIKVK